MLTRIFAWAFLIAASTVSFAIIAAAAGFSFGTTFLRMTAPVVSRGQQTASNASKASLSEGWQSYRNNELGFGLEYPVDLMDISEANNSWIVVSTKYKIPVVNWGTGETELKPYVSLSFRVVEIQKEGRSFYEASQGFGPFNFYKKLAWQVAGKDVYQAEVGVEGTGNRYYFIDGEGVMASVQIPFFGVGIDEDAVSKEVRESAEYQQHEKFDLEKKILSTFRFIQ